jgi:RNA polymerase sigma-70 factor, ECF subfamily
VRFRVSITWGSSGSGRRQTPPAAGRAKVPKLIGGGGCQANALVSSWGKRGASVALTTEEQRLHEGLYGGDAAALAEVMQVHRERLLRGVRLYSDARLARRVGADDVLQEVFLAAQSRLPHYAADGFTHPYTWLRTVMQQTLIDLHRRHLGTQMRDAAREVAHVRGLSATTRVLADGLSATITSPSGVTMRAETSDLLIAALDGLAEADREVIALRHFEDLGNREIADVLGIEEKAASIRYVRAIRRLKQALGAAGLGLSELHAR